MPPKSAYPPRTTGDPSSNEVHAKLRALHESLDDNEKLILGRIISGAKLREPSIPQVSDFKPSQREINQFQENGHLRVDRITQDQEIIWLRNLFDRILDETRYRQSREPNERGLKVGEIGPLFSCETSGDILHYLLLLQPELRYPELLETLAFRNARRFACALLGIGITELADFASIFSFKPAHYGLETPWHQEEAYWENVEYLGNYLVAWMPLDKVSAESGCLQFISGSHTQDVLRHCWEPGHPLTIDEPIDVSGAVASPVSLGGATFHHCRTLHYAGPNRTNTLRRVWLMAFHGPPSRRERPVERPWLPLLARSTPRSSNPAR
jgi:hypothetical protein